MWNLVEYEINLKGIFDQPKKKAFGLNLVEELNAAYNELILSSLSLTTVIILIMKIDLIIVW